MLVTIYSPLVVRLCQAVMFAFVLFGNRGESRILSGCNDWQRRDDGRI